MVLDMVGKDNDVGVIFLATDIDVAKSVMIDIHSSNDLVMRAEQATIAVIESICSNSITGWPASKLIRHVCGVDAEVRIAQAAGRGKLVYTDATQQRQARCDTSYPRDPLVYFYRGLALTALGDVEASLEQHDKALTLAPGFANAYCMRAELYLNSGDPAKARKDATRGRREGATTGVCSDVLGKIEN